MKKLLLSLALFSLAAAEPVSDPWFKGPVYGLPGKSLQRKKFRFDAATYYAYAKGFFTQKSRYISYKELNVDPYHSIDQVFSAGTGVFRNLDAHIHIPVSYKSLAKARSTRLGDVCFSLGYQFLKNGTNAGRPDIRIVFSETLPSGQSTSSRQGKLGTDISGSGFYMSGLTLAIQKLVYSHNQFTSFRWNIGSFLSNKARFLVRDRNGNLNLSPKWQVMSLVGSFSVEESIGYHWALSLALQAQYSRGRVFSDIDNNRHHTISFRRTFTLAPQIQYNVSKNLGFSLGSQFSLWSGPSAIRQALFKTTYLIP